MGSLLVWQSLAWRAEARRAKAGQGWIRTSVGVSQQIYSLPPLATRAPTLFSLCEPLRRCGMSGRDEAIGLCLCKLFFVPVNGLEDWVARSDGWCVVMVTAVCTQNLPLSLEGRRSRAWRKSCCTLGRRLRRRRCCSWWAKAWRQRSTLRWSGCDATRSVSWCGFVRRVRCLPWHQRKTCSRASPQCRRCRGRSM